MIHKPGKTNGAPDSTSRRVDHKEDKNADNTNMIVLTPQHFRIAALKSREASLMNDDDILKQIRQCLKHDEEVTKALTTIQKLAPPRLQNAFEDWNEENGLLLF